MDFAFLDRCIENYQRYFRDGFIDFVDGTVCAADVASPGLLFGS